MRTTKGVALGYRRNTLTDLDGRFRPVREAKARWNQLANDLGGVRELSCQKQSLLWRIVFLEGWLEDQERRMLLGEAVDETKWLSALAAFSSLLNRVGLERKARVISPLARLRESVPTGPRTSSGSVSVVAPTTDAAGEPATTEAIIEVTGEHAS